MPIQPSGGEGHSRPRAQLVKGGPQVRGATENYPMSYPMLVLYALVIIVLAAVFLLLAFLTHSLTWGKLCPQRPLGKYPRWYDRSEESEHRPDPSR
jgi:hypothetical protein